MGHIDHGTLSEDRGPDLSKPRFWLHKINGMVLISPDGPDGCCGFGGTFQLTEHEVSVRMERNIFVDRGRVRAEHLVVAETSCIVI